MAASGGVRCSTEVVFVGSAAIQPLLLGVAVDFIDASTILILLAKTNGHHDRQCRAHKRKNNGEWQNPGIPHLWILLVDNDCGNDA